MKVSRLALAATFCWNRDCPDYGKTNHGNIVKYDRTGKGTQCLLKETVWQPLSKFVQFCPIVQFLSRLMFYGIQINCILR
jgi:hypothetical protein